MGYFRAMSTMIMGNLGKATVEVRHTYFLNFTFSHPFNIRGGILFKFSGIFRYN